LKARIAELRSGPVLRWLAVSVLSAVAAAGCSQGEAVTADSLATARAAWTRAGIRDYQLEWQASGTNSAHYIVTVRNGVVTNIESKTSQGDWITAHPAEPRFYSVDGLFTTIADELAQLKTDRPFGQPRESKIVMRARFDPKLGYPLSYHRDVMGTTQSLAIDVLRLTPSTSPDASGGSPKA
jgi:Family of unknown function (DUF6174)